MLVKSESQLTEKYSVQNIQSKSCRRCNISGLCLPVMMAEAEIDHLDSIITRAKALIKGKNLYSAGDEFSHVYAIRSGCLKSYTHSQDGEEQITGFHMPGELIGLEAINAKVHLNFAQALVPSEICAIPYDQLDTLSASIPSLRRQVVAALSKEISDNYQLMLMLNQKTAEQKLAGFLINYLNRKVQRGGLSKDFSLLMTRSDLANHLGLAIETVSRILGNFTKNNVIGVNRRDVIIKDMPELCRISGTTFHP